MKSQLETGLELLQLAGAHMAQGIVRKDTWSAEPSIKDQIDRQLLLSQ
jgi:hypothetical protein